MANRETRNGFVRQKEVFYPEIIDVLDTKYDSYYISGISKDRIYLGNGTAPLHLLTSTFKLDDTLSFRIAAKYDEKVNWSAIHVQVDSPYIYLTERKTPSLIKMNLGQNGEKVNLSALKFDLIKVMTQETAIIRQYEPSLQQKFFRKISFAPSSKKENTFIPKKIQDGNFAMDGFLNYNKAKGKIFYTYYYVNKFLCLDTNLNLIYEGSTIDTNTMAKILINTTKKGGLAYFRQAKPPLFVNKRGFADGDFLYINSGLVADNEHKAEFNKYAVIDVYSVNNGRYIQSLYLPNFKGNKIRDFAVKGRVIFALFDHYLVTYHLQGPSQ
jgi:hypothetical protein